LAIHRLRLYTAARGQLAQLAAAIDRRALEYFLAVANSGTFTAAAAALNIAQPSLSQTVQGLERELGVKLFNRVKQGARLTSAGEALIAPARRILRDFEEAQASVRNVEGLRAGRLVVICPPYLAADPLPQLLGPFHHRYPEVAVRIDNALEEDVLGVLRSGDADVALAFTDPEDPTAIATRLADEEIVMVMPPGTNGFGPVVPVSTLADVSLISPTVPEHVRVRRRVRAAGITSPVLVETIHRVATVPLILAGVGAALLTRPLARQAVALGAVECRLDPPLYRQAFLITVPPVLSAAARAFLELVSELEAPTERAANADESDPPLESRPNRGQT
jgi:LysR family transcriptional regulator, carnitine catabolism transcriptional activator